MYRRRRRSCGNSIPSSFMVHPNKSTGSKRPRCRSRTTRADCRCQSGWDELRDHDVNLPETNARSTNHQHAPHHHTRRHASDTTHLLPPLLVGFPPVRLPARQATKDGSALNAARCAPGLRRIRLRHLPQEKEKPGKAQGVDAACQPRPAIPGCPSDSKSLPVRHLLNRDRPDSESHRDNPVAPLTRRRRSRLRWGQTMYVSRVLPGCHPGCGKARGREGDPDRFRAPSPTAASPPRPGPS